MHLRTVWVTQGMIPSSIMLSSDHCESALVPRAQALSMTRSFDDPVRAQQKGPRYGDAECSRNLQVDD
jgi:hypothetical protein